MTVSTRCASALSIFGSEVEKNPCTSVVALLGPITNHYSKANLGVLIVRSMDGGTTCNPDPAP